MNRVKGMGFTWSLNPYMGCAHRCAFCYVRGFERRARISGQEAILSTAVCGSRTDAVIAGQTDRLVHELGTVAVENLRIEPVVEENGRSPPTLYRLDQERLGVIGEPDVVDAGAVALGGGDLSHRLCVARAPDARSGRIWPATD